MNEQRAREILGDAIEEESGLLCQPKKLVWIGGDAAILTGGFTADELEAIAFWMRRKSCADSGTT